MIPRMADNDPAVLALEKLAEELRSRGLDPMITTSGGRVVLVVSNPAAPLMSENILVDGRWFWWSWAERIVSTEAVSAAADAISRVLSRSAT
jgi:hypothetical protein